MIEILEDIKANEKMDPNDKQNGFSETFSLQNEIDYFTRIKEKFEEEAKERRKLKKNNYDSIEELKLWKILRKDKRTRETLDYFKRALASIRREKKILAELRKKTKTSTVLFALFEKTHTKVIKELAYANQNLDNLKKIFEVKAEQV